jgi:hypothetical protein
MDKYFSERIYSPVRLLMLYVCCAENRARGLMHAEQVLYLLLQLGMVVHTHCPTYLEGLKSVYQELLFRASGCSSLVEHLPSKHRPWVQSSAP